MNPKPTEKQFAKLEREITRLLISLKPQIADDYRATDDPDDNTPGVCVTVGASFKDGEICWSYQTGDNSFSGGAYGHPFWGVVYLNRRSNSKELAKDCVNEIADAMLAN